MLMVPELNIMAGQLVAIGEDYAVMKIDQDVFMELMSFEMSEEDLMLFLMFIELLNVISTSPEDFGGTTERPDMSEGPLSMICDYYKHKLKIYSLNRFSVKFNILTAYWSHVAKECIDDQYFRSDARVYTYKPSDTNLAVVGCTFLFPRPNNPLMLIIYSMHNPRIFKKEFITCEFLFAENDGLVYMILYDFIDLNIYLELLNGADIQDGQINDTTIKYDDVTYTVDRLYDGSMIASLYNNAMNLGGISYSTYNMGTIKQDVHIQSATLLECITECIIIGNFLINDTLPSRKFIIDDTGDILAEIVEPGNYQFEFRYGKLIINKTYN